MAFIYLDYAAATPLDKRVKRAMEPFLLSEYGNASSLHKKGKNARVALEDARRRVASVLNVNSRTIIFTSGATESNNLALVGVARSHRGKGNHVIISAVEHPSVDETATALEADGFVVTRIGVDGDGVVNVKELISSITPKTILVSVMYANNEVGTVQPIHNISKGIRRWRTTNSCSGPLLHTDAVQAVNYLDVRPDKIGVDLMTLSSGKIYGPKGVGMLYVRDGVEISPLTHGGGQEWGMRSGTENIAGIVGFSVALDIAVKLANRESIRIAVVRDYLLKHLLKIPGVVVNGGMSGRLPNNINISFPGLDGEALVIYLDAKGVAVSTGSACASTKKESSRVLAAMNLPSDRIRGAVRFSLGRDSKRSDIKTIVRIVNDVVKTLSRK